jgi:hypothetical protein
MKNILSGFGFFLLVALFGLFTITTESCKHEPLLLDMVIPIDTMPTDTMPIDTMMIDTSGIPCDTDKVYFSRDILPILNSNCAISGCHDPQSATEGVILNSYENLFGTTKVRAFDLNDTEIYELITESDESKRMPPAPQSPLAIDQIQTIAKWILQGADSLSCDEINTCDTIAVSYMTDIVPILQNNCYGCHGSVAPSGNIMLNSFTGVSTVAENGRLVGAVTHSTGYESMPQNQDKLPDCDIANIVGWVNQGAKNN